MSFNRRSFLFQLSRASLASLGMASLLGGCANDAEEVLIVRLNVFQPRTNDQICIDQDFPIQWDLSGQSNLDIEFSLDNGQSWQPLFEDLPGQLNEKMWKTPNATTTQASLRFLRSIDKTVLATSGVFSLVNPSLKLIDPEPGLVYTGQNIPIRWEHSCVESIRIEYSTNGGISWKTIAEKIPANLGTYTWDSPLLFSQLGKIRILNEQNPANIAIHDEYIALTPRVRLKLTDYPNLSRIEGVQLLDLPIFGNIIVLRLSDDTFKVMSPVCTHQGCGLETDNEGESWFCRCHGGTFSKKGCPTGGPVEFPLEEYLNEYDKSRGELIVAYQSKPGKC
jgi:Rieske Fe-S protein